MSFCSWILARRRRKNRGFVPCVGRFESESVRAAGDFFRDFSVSNEFFYGFRPAAGGIFFGIFTELGSICKGVLIIKNHDSQKKRMTPP